jgi:hypothetical protein
MIMAAFFGIEHSRPWYVRQIGMDVLASMPSVEKEAGLYN